MPGFFDLARGLEVPLELHARRAVGAWRHKCAAKFWRHDHFPYVFFVEQVTSKSGHFPTLTAYTDSEIRDAVGVNLRLGIAGGQTPEQYGRYPVRMWQYFCCRTKLVI